MTPHPIKCRDCEREMTAAEWESYFPRRDIVMAQGEWRWHCGCNGGEPKLVLRFFADLVCAEPTYAATFDLGEEPK